jgi:adenylate cyclase
VLTGVAFVDGDKLCERSENVLLGRARCGRVYRRPHSSVGGGGDYVYVSPDKLFYFSVEGS